jgi:2-methylisocitrate lyase-like PEP mutase family enzyme/uncharacterized protein YceH (UPF0502 family)
MLTDDTTTARLPRPLDPIEVRVLGALLEKQQTTPEYYPLTLNALAAACNQKTNRDPVMALSEGEVRAALERLREHVLVWQIAGSRSEKWEQNAEKRWELDSATRALLTLLLLRGAQTPGELRSRSNRLHAFASITDVEAALRDLASGPEALVAELPRAPGQKEARWAHLVGGHAGGGETTAPGPYAERPDPAMLVSSAQKERASKFLELHRMNRPFVLANCWDVVTALLFAREGFPAIGTSSYAMAATLGRRDGQQINLQETVNLVARLVCRVKLPISADIEAGYAETVGGVVRSAKAVFAAGAVGINIEDATGDPQRPLFDVTFQCEKVAAIRAMGDAAGFHPVINARTDTFLLTMGDRRERLREAIVRGRAYAKAGADCVFVPDMGDLDAAALRQLVDAIGAPLNVVAGASTPPMATLEEIGIARVSLGPRVLRAGLGLFREIAREILDRGTFTKVTTGALSYEETNQLLTEPEG